VCFAIARLIASVIHWRHGAEGQLLILNFWFSEKLLLENCHTKVQNLVRKIEGRIKILSTFYFLCWKFAVSVGKLKIPTHSLL